MAETRRSFLKKAAVVGTVAAAGSIAATASTGEASYSSNGVVVGKSPKKEILYKKTKAWDDFYRTAL
ncbi:twin-arginine translocation signal domain-containing protein [Sulfurospirillum arcachonense]|uniref:twin-arginine translocation signal domain-containing protein n=1 Tax=Sulfurospirillum arcachonense TaxID=57666 RepID=UPI00046AB7D6|nr:twin-arginine translocation signal domain-containing protein [Sulfurospirillum arcachonense]